LHTYCRLADDWPRHLHCAQKALARVIIAKSTTHPTFTGELDALAESDWTRVTAQFAQYRMAYYRDRVSPEIKTYQSLIATVMKTLPTDVSRSSVLDVLAGDSKKPDFLYYSKATLAFFDHLIHQGVLQEDADGIVSCPIPSFRTWLIEAGQFQSTTYTIRHGSDICREGTFDSLSAARDWAVTQLGDLTADQEVSLWQGAVAIDIL